MRRGILPGCCARAASGQRIAGATAAPPRSVMNSRRLMSLSPLDHAECSLKDTTTIAAVWGFERGQRTRAAVSYFGLRMSGSGQLRRSDEMSGMSALPLIAAEWCGAIAE